MQAENILTIGIDYRNVRGGIAAVESVYSSFYKPFNHIATVVDGGKLKKLFTFFSAVTKFLYWMIFHKEIEIVHVHGASDASFYRKRIFINIAKAFGKKVVYHCHGAEYKRFAEQHHDAVGRMLKKCDCIIALSQSWKEWFEKEFHNENVTVIKNVISAPVIMDDTVKNARFTLLFLGRLGQRKGVYDLLDVIACNKARYENNLLLLLGGDGETDKVQEIIQKEKLNNIVHYEGWVSGDKKVRLLNKADAYILPSYNEGLPISVLEAMSYSLPVVSTNVGGIPEILKNGINGYMVTPGDKKGIERAIDRLMCNADLRRDMGKASSIMVKEHLPEYVAQQLSDLYKNISDEKVH